MNWSNDSMRCIAEIVSEITGFTFPEARRPFSEAAIRRVADRHGHAGISHLANALRTDPRLQQEAIDELIVGETYFFRDPEQFTFLSSTVLPEIAATLAAEERISIWCAGCASGEEPYSLAMMLDRLGLASRSHILATDLSRAAIEHAKRARYTRWSFRAQAAPWRDRWFTFRDNTWQARPELRERVEFEVQNLVDFSKAPVRGAYHLILCRNVLMYLETGVAAKIVEALASALNPRGWLLLSPSDPTPPQSAGLEPALTPAGILYQRTEQSIDSCLPARVIAAPIAGTPPIAEEASRDERQLDPQLHVTLAMMLLDLNLPEAAIAAARRAIYLDRSLAVAHFTLGRALRQRGKLVAARRAFQRAQALLSTRSKDGAVRCAESITVGTLAANTAAELSLL